MTTTPALRRRRLRLWLPALLTSLGLLLAAIGLTGYAWNAVVPAGLLITVIGLALLIVSLRRANRFKTSQQ